MRFAYFLLVAASALLSSVTASAGDFKDKLPALSSTDAVVPARAVDSSNGKRVLRTHPKDDVVGNDEEERRNPDLLEGEALAAWVAKWEAKARLWFRQGKTPAKIEDKLSGLRGAHEMGTKNGRKFAYFLELWNRAHPNDPHVRG